MELLRETGFIYSKIWSIVSLTHLAQSGEEYPKYLPPLKNKENQGLASLINK